MAVRKQRRGRRRIFAEGAEGRTDILLGTDRVRWLDEVAEKETALRRALEMKRATVSRVEIIRRAVDSYRASYRPPKFPLVQDLSPFTTDDAERKEAP